MGDLRYRSIDEYLASEEYRNANDWDVPPERQHMEDPHLLSRDELIRMGALDVPPAWRKSLSAQLPKRKPDSAGFVQRDLFSDSNDDKEPLPKEPLPDDQPPPPRDEADEDEIWEAAYQGWKATERRILASLAADKEPLPDDQDPPPPCDEDVDDAEDAAVDDLP